MGDIIAVIAIAVALLLAVLYKFRKKGTGNCHGCSGCCSDCTQKEPED
ncbi:MAG: FeoB-associated Cys-rich membrane protein [Acetatifactor sp.]